MKEVRPLVLEGHGIRLEPLVAEHAPALAAAAGDGQLWELWYIAVPPPDGMPAYVATALEGQRAGHMLPWVVRDVASDTIIGSTRY
ncbi:MAG TPA: GNAT family N-acetyltransferase, partial [Gemmatimonadales bacterium]|nr:GNAT family N-acetyltransferase [Gemmatimonadales bacterium]